MTTEDDFQAALDADPDDWQTRLVFADWLDERGDARAAYFRLAGQRQWRPAPDSTSAYPYGTLQVSLITGDRLWRYYNSSVQRAPATLPFDVGDGNWLHNTRREAEDAAASAFAKLPPERRAELIAGTPAKRRKRKK